jgi:hypothetical protein
MNLVEDIRGAFYTDDGMFKKRCAEETPRKWSADVNSELSQLLEMYARMTNAIVPDDR